MTIVWRDWTKILNMMKNHRSKSKIDEYFSISTCRFCENQNLLQIYCPCPFDTILQYRIRDNREYPPSCAGGHYNAFTGWLASRPGNFKSALKSVKLMAEIQKYSSVDDGC